MKWIEAKSGKFIFARLFEDEDVLEAIIQIAERSGIEAGFFFLIGTLKKAKMGFFHEGRYQPIEMTEPLEIVSCMGNISIKEKQTLAHAHIAVSNKKGEAFGGHVLPGCIIAATGELVLVEAVDVELQRKLDEKTQLFLWSIGKQYPQ
ncbi:MAG: DNA-binding protein [Candidatus Bathyarchaeota archaeon]|jgi:predicted DNA-binding protein with PD1-like motif